MEKVVRAIGTLLLVAVVILSVLTYAGIFNLSQGLEQVKDGVSKLVTWFGLSYEPLYDFWYTGNCSRVGDYVYSCGGFVTFTFRANTTAVRIAFWSDKGTVYVGSSSFATYNVVYQDSNKVVVDLYPMKGYVNTQYWRVPNVVAVYGTLDINVYGDSFMVYFDVRPLK
ncbi:MAG: hypothetical protein NWE95_01955 [Candidatus Bathyarchaeota archaeon]|nr:hypothetical protein [Candidatus Bathyarchaeota archaeon]